MRRKGSSHRRNRSMSQVSISEESDDYVSQPPPSPGTVEGKQWERQYRSFLGGGRKPSPTHTGSEKAVKGGSLFANIFGTSGSLSSSQRRVKSVADDLDGTKRRGSERAYASQNELQHIISPDILSRDEGNLQQLIDSGENSALGMGRFAAMPVSRSADSFAVRSRFVPPAPPSIPTRSGKPTRTVSVPVQNHSLPAVSELFLDSGSKKKAFTAFHNSSETGRDSGSAFLGGEESSVRNQGLWNSKLQYRGVPHSGYNAIERKEHHADDSVVYNDQRILRPIHGTDQWQNGRRYLIAPATLSACIFELKPDLEKSQQKTTSEHLEQSNFGSILLGECWLSYVSQENSTVSKTSSWTKSFLILRQNYLLEYSALDQPPRGYANLQYGKCGIHVHFQDTIELHFYASPCARGDFRVLMIRLADRNQRDNWCTCLQRASELNINDLYDYDPSEKPLGIGLYAKVYPARRQVDGSACALKIFDKNQFWKLVKKGRERADTLVREVSVQATLTSRCRYDSFLKLQGFFETSDNVVLEMELLGGRDLFHFIKEHGTLRETQAAIILVDLLKALVGMKHLGLAHRDIKPANILMYDHKHAKLCDFGMAAFSGVDGRVRGRCGTPGYVAPEIFSLGTHGGYDCQVDVFSAGVTLYVMLCGYEPFYGETDDELVEANRKADIDFPVDDWRHISAEAKDLIKKMTVVNPRERLDAEAALDHAWLRRHCPREFGGSMSPPSGPEATNIFDDAACVIS